MPDGGIICQFELYAGTDSQPQLERVNLPLFYTHTSITVEREQVSKSTVCKNNNEKA